MQKPRATIFGGRGFIGQHLEARLLATGWDCNIPSRQMVINTKDNMGHVFYCAGLTADYTNRPFDTIEAHVSLLSRILQANCFESLIYLSSTRLYDNQKEGIGTEERSLSLNPLIPRHIYDLSKALGESLCSVMGKGRARIARLSCVYNDHTDQDGFLPGLLKQIISRRPSFLEVDSSPAFSRDYVHLQDVLDALILITTQGEGIIYNVASGENICNKDLFATLSKASGCKIISLRHDSSTPPPKISIQKIQHEFDWSPISVLKKTHSIIKENIGC